MPEGELDHILQWHRKCRIFVGHASKREADGQTAPWFAQTQRVANSASGMCHSGGGSTLDRKPIEPGAHPSEDQLWKVFACFHHFMQNTTTSSSLGQPSGLERDSAASAASIVDPNVSATVRELNDNAFGFEFLLHNFGSGVLLLIIVVLGEIVKPRLLKRVAK